MAISLLKTKNPVFKYFIGVITLIGFIFHFSFSQNGDTNLLHQGGSILFIGNSNTQRGLINAGIKDKLTRQFGFFGHGFVPFHFQTDYRPIPSGISWTMSKEWTKQDMLESSKDVEVAVYYAPSGHWIESNKPNSKVTVKFDYDEPVDFQLMYLGDVADGHFMVSLNGSEIQTNSIKEIQKQTKSLVVPNIPRGANSLVIEVLSGDIHLFGFQIKHQINSDTNYSVIHNWGNGWSTTRDWVNIDSVTLVTGIEALDPDITLILLGTNDHLRSISTPDEIKKNMITLVNRVKASKTDTRIMILSTTGCGGCPGKELLKEYSEVALPEAARETNVAFWDLYTWFGLNHNVHFNAEEGQSIADELWDVLNQTFRIPAIVRVGEGLIEDAVFRFDYLQPFSSAFEYPAGKTVACYYNISGALIARVEKGDRGVLRSNVLGFVRYE